jgi:hypothetical protein
MHNTCSTLHACVYVYVYVCVYVHVPTLQKKQKKDFAVGRLWPHDALRARVFIPVSRQKRWELLGSVSGLGGEIPENSFPPQRRQLLIGAPLLHPPPTRVFCNSPLTPSLTHSLTRSLIGHPPTSHSLTPHSLTPSLAPLLP